MCSLLLGRIVKFISEGCKVKPSSNNLFIKCLPEYSAVTGEPRDPGETKGKDGNNWGGGREKEGVIGMSE
jgi:hypothetical protein